MIGKPKYDYDQKVSFTMKDGSKEITLEGTVYIVDAYGTFEQNEEPSYDIMVDKSPHFNNEPCLYKHIREQFVKEV
jgi:hypothetical protein